MTKNITKQAGFIFRISFLFVYVTSMLVPLQSIDAAPAPIQQDAAVPELELTQPMSIAAPGPKPATGGYTIASQDEFKNSEPAILSSGPVTVDSSSVEKNINPLSGLFSPQGITPAPASVYGSYDYNGGTPIPYPSAWTGSGLTIEPITAYNVIVDSNVLSPSSYGPNAATLGAKYCNSTAGTLTNVWAYIGDYNTGTPTSSTPGTYPQHNPSTDASFATDFPHLDGGSPDKYDNTTAVDSGDPARFYALEHEGGSVSDVTDASRYIGTLTTGQCRTVYWLVSYPRKAYINGGWVDVTGGVKSIDDLWLQYDLWGQVGTTNTADYSYYTRSLTMRNEISAMANKIWPNGDNKVPDQYVSAIADVLGWDTLTPSGGSAAYPGETVTSQGIWYDFGNVGAGFDNNQDLVPDRNAWVQPIGDAGAYDPGCFRLVRTYGLVVVKLTDGTELLIPFVDQMYFEGIPDNNTGSVGLVYYEYMALDGACTASLTPYQEVASGYDNEKFNADFGAGIPPLQSRATNMTFDKTGQATSGLGGTINYSMTFTLPDADTGNTTTTVTIGNPTTGMPLTFYDSVPIGMQYLSGSASANVTMANYYLDTNSDGNYDAGEEVNTVSTTRLFSIDGGTNWTSTDPGNYTSSSAGTQLIIQWQLSSAVVSPPSVNGSDVTGTVSFNAVIPNAYTGTMVSNTACLKLGNAPCFIEDTHNTLVTGAYTITGNIFCDDGRSTGGAPCNTGSTGGATGSAWRENGSDEPGMPNISVSLYYDVNNNNSYDSALLYTITNGYIDLNGSGTVTSTDDGSLFGYPIIDGAIDFNKSGAITVDDDGSLAGYAVVDGLLDIDSSAAISSTDDGLLALSDTLITTTTTTSYKVFNGQIDMDGDSSATTPDTGDDGTLLGYAIIDGRVDLNGGGVSTTDDGTFAGFTVVDGYLNMNRDGAAVVDANDDGTIAPYYFTGLPGNSNFVIIVDTADGDIPTGYTNTTPAKRSADIVATNLTDIDFAFGPALSIVKRLDSPGITIIGQTADINYTLLVTNNIPGSGGVSNYCTYRVFPSIVYGDDSGTPPGGNGANSQWLVTANASNPPDGASAYTNLTNNENLMGLSGFNIGDMGGSITSVKYIAYISEKEDMIDNDRIEIVPYYNNAAIATYTDQFHGDGTYKRNNITTTLPSGSNKFNDYAVGTDLIFKADLTAYRSWTFADFTNNKTEVQVNARKGSGSTHGNSYFDAFAFEITTDQVCNDPAQIINPLPLTDVFESFYMSLDLAEPPISSSSTTGSGASALTTLTWDNIGPLYPGQTKEVSVKLHANNTTASDTNGLNNGKADNSASITTAKFGNGRDTNDVTDDEPVTIVAPRYISGTVWYDIDGDGWQATNGYEASPTDGKIPNVEVELYVCQAVDDTYVINTTDNKDCAFYNGTWVLYDTTVTSAYTIIDGLLDVNRDGSITIADDGTSDGCTVTDGVLSGCTTYFGYSVISGYIDVDRDNATNPDTGDDISIGEYKFSGLYEGYYRVVVDSATLPTGATQTGDPNDTTNLCGTCDNQFGLTTNNLTSGELANLVGLVNTSRTNVNFGYDYNAGVYGSVWENTDGDRTNDSGEPNISGVTVRLYVWTDDGDGVVEALEVALAPTATDITDANGNYFFDSLTGGTKYVVNINTATLPSGNIWTITDEDDPGSSDDSITDVDNTPPTLDITELNYIGFTAAINTNVGSLDFGVTRSGTYRIGDTLFYDWNANGTQNYVDVDNSNSFTAGDYYTDEGIPNVTVTLYTDNDGDGIVESGDFSVNTTSTFAYKVVDGKIDIDQNSTAGSANDDSTNISGVTNTSGTSQPGADVIDGLFDVDGINGIDGNDDGYFNGIKIIDGYLDIDGDNTVGAGDLNNGDDIEIGQYTFNYLGARGYVVVVNTADPQFPTLLTESKDPDETGACTICNSRGTVTSTEMTTASAGFHNTEDFGYYPLGGGSIGDTVFKDVNGNGVQLGTLETGIPNITVTLQVDLNGDGTYVTIATDVTDSNGAYLFSNLPTSLSATVTSVSYRVIVDSAAADIPEDAFGLTYAASTVTTYTVILGDQDNNNGTAAVTSYLSADFGFAALGAFGDTVYWDANANGTQDFNETGISGVTVNLYKFTDGGDGDGVYDSGDSFTDTNGNGVRDAEIFTDTDNDGVRDSNEPYIDLNGNGSYDAETFVDDATSGGTVGKYDAPEGFLNLDNSVDGFGNPTYTSGETFYDITDGRYQPGEDLASTAYKTDTTDSDGMYLFTGLPVGKYAAVVSTSGGSPVNGRTLTADPDSDGIACTELTSPAGAYEMDSHFCDSTAGMQIFAGTNFMGADFGYQPTGVIGDRLWIDSNNNGLYDSGETGISDVDVFLCDSTDALPCNSANANYTSVTDANGNYQFLNITDGTYYVVVNTADTDLSSLGLTQTFEKNNGGSAETITAPDSITNPDNRTQVVMTSGTVSSINGTACTSCGLDVDFGYRFVGTASISGTICLDNPTVTSEKGYCGSSNIDPNGTDSTESPYDNIAVYLYKLNDTLPYNGIYNAGETTTLVSTTTTSAYKIVDGRVDINQNGATSYTVTGGQVDINQNGFVTFTVVGGKIDLNGGGISGTDDFTNLANTVDIIDGMLDLNSDGVSDGADDGSFNGVTVTDGLLVTADGTYADAYDDYTNITGITDIVNGLVDINGDTFINGSDNGTFNGLTVTAGVIGTNGTSNDIADDKLNISGVQNTSGVTMTVSDVIDGLIDVDGNAIINSDDDGFFNGYPIVNGYVDIDGDGVTSGDAGDDIEIGDYRFSNMANTGTTYYIIAIGTPQAGVDLSLSAANGAAPSTLTAVNSGGDGAQTTSMMETAAGDGSTLSVFQVVQVNDGVTSVTDRDFAFYQSAVYDFGDLSEAYPTLLEGTPDGARHLQPSGTKTLYLGLAPTTESNGQPSIGATLDSDQGVNDLGTLPENVDGWADAVSPKGALEVKITGTGWLVGWVDGNNDGDFADVGEMIISQSASTGTVNLDFSTASLHDKTKGTYSFRFRLFPSKPAVPALAYSGVASNGEVEDYRFTPTGGVATPVTLNYFLAQRRGSAIDFKWSTATETGNMGFNLYVENNGIPRKINRDIIPSQVVDSLSRQDYAYSVDMSGETFYIEDVDINGGAKMQGPFRIEEEFGNQLEVEEVNQQAINAEFEAKFTARQNSLKQNMKVPAQALYSPILQPQLASQSLTGGNPNLQLTDTLSLKVRTNGIYRVTYEELRDAGLDLLDVPVSKIALTNDGKQTPVTVKPRKTNVTKFGPGGYIEFYGKALDTVYTDTNIYIVQVIRSAALRISGNKAAPIASLKPAASFTETVSVNKAGFITNPSTGAIQANYAATTPGSDPWYDTLMFTPKITPPQTLKYWEYPFQVTGLANATAAASMEVTFFTQTNQVQNPDHHVQASVNGTPLGDQIFEGAQEVTMKLALPAGILHEGENILRITLPGDITSDIVFFDKFNVKYQRTFEAKDGRLTFTASGKKFNVTNLPNANTVVYRMTSKGLILLSGVKFAKSGTTYTASFAGTTQADTYYVTAAGAAYKPVSEITRVIGGNMKPAQYLIISHPNFINDAKLQELISARVAQGLTVSVVDVNDIYSKYSYGIFDPQAIKKYITFASRQGTQYVLLVGGDTYDYRNYTGLNSISFIPSLYTVTGPIAKFVPVDPLYGDINDDKIPDLAIGRFPVRLSSELALMVDKTLAYQAKEYRRTAFFASDKLDPKGIFFRDISKGLEYRLPNGWVSNSAHLDDNMTIADARARLLESMNSGNTALITYTGHSGAINWSSTNLFTSQDAKTLTNNGKPFVVVQWGCWNTYYTSPNSTYLVQNFLFSGDQGAAAVFGASTLTDSESEQLLGEMLMPRLTTPGMPMGLALRDAKLELAKIHPELLDVLLGWTLMGDPALIVEPQ